MEGFIMYVYPRRTKENIGAMLFTTVALAFVMGIIISCGFTLLKALGTFLVLSMLTGVASFIIGVIAGFLVESSKAFNVGGFVMLFSIVILEICAFIYTVSKYAPACS
jgi:ABC-type spermidine/putrescine transport system permease subunit I